MQHPRDERVHSAEIRKDWPPVPVVPPPDTQLLGDAPAGSHDHAQL